MVGLEGMVGIRTGSVVAMEVVVGIRMGSGICRGCGGASGRGLE